MKKSLLLICALLVFTSLTALADIVPVDLSSWTALTLDLPGGQSAGNWVLSNGNTTVTQTINADPSFFTNNMNISEYTMEGTWRVNTGGDDDFMGFVFGYQDPSHFYLFDWKQNAQNVSGYGQAEEGMSIKVVDAPDLSDLTQPDFWLSVGTEYTTVLASNFGSGTGWNDYDFYTFKLTVSVGSYTVEVFDGETLLWNATINDFTYSGGQFGFYNYSQATVQYAGFTLNVPPVCDAGGPYHGNAGVPVQFVGSNSFDEDGEIVSWDWDFGDGNTGSGENPTHTYEEDGTYDVTLCVTDNEGLVSCCSPTDQVVPTESRKLEELKALYR